MNNIEANWNDEQFKAYLLIYASQSDQIETIEEKDFIESHFDKQLLKMMYKEINKDNDYQRIQKIMSFVKLKQYSDDDLRKILNDIKDIYMIDGNFDAPEQMIFSILKKLFNIT